ncbi:LysM peptidoglycan-binding domain-containing protein [Laceyella putida]|uniref:LysM peptidoglycan-binding domain-containing protein n=1 Tax=Laceyella putida TaxID=110101 RepID=A0ABW2RIM2_9BACL
MKIHIARAGESLWQLAQKYNIPVERLREANPALEGAVELKAGDKIRIPTGKVPLIATQQDKKPDTPAFSDLQEQKTVAKPEPEEGQKPFSTLPTPPQMPEMPDYEVFDWDSSSPWEPSFYEEASYPVHYPPPMPPFPGFVHGFWPAFPPGHPTAYPSAYDPYVPVPAPIHPAAYPMIQGGLGEGVGNHQGYAAYAPYPEASATSYYSAEGWNPPGYWQQPQVAQMEPARFKESSSTIA